MTRQTEFIQKILPYAQEVQAKYGVPASLVIAQAALESGWGDRALGNNYFGIKAGKSWKGESQNFDTHEIENGQRVAVNNEKFRAYGSLRESVMNYGELMMKDRYAAVRQTTNGFDAAEAVAKAGYAPGDYADKVKSVIRSNNLAQYDDVKFKGYDAPENGKKFDLLNVILQLISGVFSMFDGNKEIASADQTSIETPNVPHKKTDPAPQLKA